MERRRRLAATVAPVALPAAVLAGLGGWLLARGYGLWYDELYTAAVAPLPLGRLWSALVSGTGTIAFLADAPPSYNAPYYAVAHLWLGLTGLAPDEWGLRLLSLVAAVAALAVLGRAVARLAGPWVGLVAGLVLATNPFVVRYAVEARGYGLTMLATAAVGLSFVRWLEDRPGAVAAHGVAVSLAGLAHWFALTVPLALAVAALGLRRRQALPLVAATAAGAVPALALVALALANGVGGSGATWIPAVGLGAPRILLRSWSGQAWLLAAATVVAAAAAVVGRGPAAPRVVAAAWVGVPVAVVTVGGLLRPLFVDRYLLAALLGLGVLVALGLRQLPRPLAPVAAALLVGTSALVTTADVRAGPLEDVRGAVAYVAAHRAAGEPVVAPARWDALGVDHYARARHPEMVEDLVLPPEVLPPVHPAEVVPAGALGPAEQPPATAVWVVRRAAEGVAGDAAKVAELDRRLRAGGMVVTTEVTMPGRMADVVVQRWARVAG